MNDLQKLFASELKEIYDAEQQLIEALGELEQKAVSGGLKSAFHEHLEQTRAHASRLDEVFREIGQSPGRKTCHGIAGIINESDKLAEEFKATSPLDAALITTAQKAEHYEIVSYGSLCSWAEELGNVQTLDLLKQNLREEKAAEAKLRRLTQDVEVESRSRGSKPQGEMALNRITTQNA